MKNIFWYLSSIILTKDPLLSSFLRVMLKSTGFGHVDVADDLPRLRKRQAELRHDLIVADSELGALDGADLLLLARADPALAPGLFIIVTQDTSFRFFERCMRRGADAVIHKPVSPEALAGAVVRLLASRRAWRGKIVPHPRSLPQRGFRQERLPAPRH